MEDFKIYFPHEKIRDEQNRLIEKVKTALLTKNNLIAHAPTGLGKTAAVLAPAISYALEKNLTVIFLTSRHTQHMIAVNTLKKIKEMYGLKFHVADIIGKKGMCLQPGVELLSSSDFSEYCRAVREKDKCNFYTNTRKGNKLTPMAAKVLEDMKSSTLHTQEIIEACKNPELCPYEIVTALAAESKAIIADYYYIFNNDIRNSFFKKADKELGSCILIVDEAHNLPNRIKTLMTERISGISIKKAIIEAKKNSFDDAIPTLVAIQDILNNLGEELKKGLNERIVEKEEFVDAVNKIKNYYDIMQQFFLLADIVHASARQSYIGSVAKFLAAWKGPDEGFARIISYKYIREMTFVLSYRCLDPSLVAHDVVNNTYSTILMSATLNPTDMYKDLLGFDKTMQEEFENPFPQKNRMNLIVPLATTKFQQRNEKEFAKIALICAEIANAIPGNTAFYFPSYDMMSKVSYYFTPQCNKTIFTEIQRASKQEREDLLKKFSSYKDSGAVLLAVASGSYGEGIDLPGVLKGVVVVGLPLQQPDLETKKLIEYYQEQFGRGWDYGYIFPAINKALQAAGRCIRSEFDRGVIVYLDERYATNYRGCFIEGDYEITEDYVGKIKEFFNQVN